MKLYSEAATLLEHQATFDPEASWLKFHLGINRYALYTRDDPAITRLLQDMQATTVISAGRTCLMRVITIHISGIHMSVITIHMSIKVTVNSACRCYRTLCFNN